MHLSAERAQEITSQTFTDLDFHLDNWARWMRQNEGPEGLPSTASGGLVGNKYSWDPDASPAYAKLDSWLAEHADEAIKALSPAERAALYHAYDLTAVWHFPRGNYDELIGSARAKVRDTLLRRGVVVT
jgi:hypothetical protein